MGHSDHREEQHRGGKCHKDHPKGPQRERNRVVPNRFGIDVPWRAVWRGLIPKRGKKSSFWDGHALQGLLRGGKSQNDLEQLPSTVLQPPSTTQSGCSPAKECPVSPAGRPCGHFRKPCAKTFGERCALEGLLEGVVSPNAAKLASLVTNVPCRPL